MKHRVERASREAVERRLDRRGEAEFILGMARHLAPADRVLVEYIYGQGRSVAEYARLVRCSVRTAQRRLAVLTKRIYSKDFQFLLVDDTVLPREYRAVARRLILEGRGLRRTARITGRSLHRVRRQHTELRAILDAQIRQWNPPILPPQPRPEDGLRAIDLPAARG